MASAMPSAETVLQKAAADGSLDSAEWPATLQYILGRLDEIVSDFPKPPTSSASTAPADTDTALPPQNPISSQESHTTDKENAPPSRPPIPTFSAPVNPQGLPQDITTFYSSIRNTLSKNFAKHPPHTVQRLAELVIEPKRRYKFLPPYLRALDRVVSVSSPLVLFPLPQAILPTAGGLLNGTTSPTSTQSALGSDESLGGALLTPIPWLQNRGQNELISESTEMVDGPNGAGRIETVTVGMLRGEQQQRADSSPTNQTSPTATGSALIMSSHPDGESLSSTGPVTQGELLRQEQEAGIVVNNPHSLTTSPTRTTYGEMEGGGTIVETVEGEEEAPHARGPELIGLEDTGPQKAAGALNIEGAVGRPSIDRSSKSPGPPAGAPTDGEEKKSDAEMKDGSTEDAEKATDAESEDVDMKSGE